MKNLMLHKGTIAMSRRQIAKLKTPQATKTFKPVPHIELIETLEESLNDAGMKSSDGEFGVGRKGKILFGTMKVKYNMGSGGEAVVGFRQACDRTMSIQICAGFSVIVCDNLVFRGDMIALRRKHTSRLDLKMEIDEAVTRVREHLASLKNEIAKLKRLELSENEAKANIHDLFCKSIMPMRYMKRVSQEYFNPRHREFRPRTAWSLHNAFTEVAKCLPIISKFAATQQLGVHFGMTNKK